MTSCCWMTNERYTTSPIQMADRRGTAVTTDPRIVDYCRDIRTRPWKPPIPYAEYSGT